MDAYPGFRIAPPGATLTCSLRELPAMHGCASHMAFVVSPVPKGEGPGAPSSWLGKVTGTGATRLTFVVVVVVVVAPRA